MTQAHESGRPVVIAGAGTVDRNARAALGMGIGSVGAIGVSAALVGIRHHLASANAALVLVLFVLLGAVIGGRKAGLVVAFVAGMSFDFFHTRPYGSLKISDGQDIIATALLLIVGVIVGEVAVGADRIRDATRRGGTGVKRIHAVASLAAAGSTSDELISAVCNELRGLLQLEGCWFEPHPYGPPLATIETNGALDTHEYHYTPTGFELPRGGAQLVIRSGDETLGRIVLLPRAGVGTSVDDRLVAVALADQVGIVLGREGSA